ncbi:MAG: oligosaccharide flippase family protein [Bacteroidales bacterium]|nr:oligosaccharide flippase family protein [Bacteroidales bacterium]
MRKKLFSSILLFLLLNILIKPFWILGIDVNVQNAVGAEEFGLYFAIFNFTFIFNILLDLGITNFNNKNIAQHNQLISKHLSGILSIKLILFVFFLAVTFFVGWLIGYNSRSFLLLAWMCFNQFLNSLIIYLRSNFSGLLLFKTDSILSVLDRVLMIVFCSILLWGDITNETFKIEWFIGAQTLSYLITVFVALTALVRKTNIKRLTLNIPFSIAIIKKSLPFALLVLLMSSYNRIDPIMLERLLPCGNTSAGIYASAYRLLDALVMLSYLISVPLLPIYAKMLKNKENIGSITKSVFVCVFALVSGIAITLSCCSNDIMTLLYTSHTEASSNVFRILIFGFIPISITYIFGTLLTANGNLKQLNILSAITLAINIIINIVLIPRLHEVGSAYASLAAQSFVAITQVALSFKIFKFKPDYELLLKLSIYVLFIIGCNIVLPHLGINWVMHIAIVGIVMILTLFALRLIRIKDIITIIKER